MLFNQIALEKQNKKKHFGGICDCDTCSTRSTIHFYLRKMIYSYKRVVPEKLSSDGDINALFEELGSSQTIDIFC